MAVGGDIIEVTYNHPTLGTGVFFPKAGEDSNYDLGGLRSSDDANNVDGGGRDLVQLNRVKWFFEVAVAWDMNDTNSQELEKATALAADPVSADWTFTHVNGTIYGGKGRPVGDLQGNGNSATFPLKVSGGGKLKKIP